MNERLFSEPKLEYEAGLIANDTSLTMVFNLIPVPMGIVNNQRQLIYINDAMKHDFKLLENEPVLGHRPGELFKCSHAEESDFKCGTSEWCCYCGISNAVKESLANGQTVTAECVISGKSFSPKCIKVQAQPYPCKGEIFTMLVFQDISESYWRSLLERVFFHDLRNLVMMLSSLATLNPQTLERMNLNFKDQVLRIAEHMGDEISAQQEMLEAENNKLETHPGPINSLELVRTITDFFGQTFANQDKRICISENSIDIPFVSDIRLVRRVMVNMVKNAFEAIQAGESVTLSSIQEGEYVRLSVHNPGQIPPEIQFQLFQQAFSTKGSGRGMGTYSMKLLTERYLAGKIGFTSSPQSGTLFYALYKINQS